jgi:hypothetical protein
LQWHLMRGDERFFIATDFLAGIRGGTIFLAVTLDRGSL